MNQPEDHMDELFRKAGENYPLKTGGSDWDKVLAGLQNKPDAGTLPVSDTGSASRGRQWRWLLLLLLIPLGWVGAHYAGWTGHKSAGIVASAPVASTPGQAAASGSATASGNSATPANPGAAAPAVSGAPLTPGQAAASGSATANSSASVAATSSAEPTHGGAGTKAQDKVVATSDPSRIVDASRSTIPTAGASTGENEGPLEVTTRIDNGIHKADLANDDPSYRNPMIKSTPNLSGTGRPMATLSVQNSEAGKSASTAKPASTNKAAKERGFYAGVLIGPDFTSIKGQSIQNPGYSLGLLLGYRVNRRLAVEAAALWDHKAYYTNGEYFNKKKAGIPDNVAIQDMTGYCNMFEIPLSVRYDFWILKHGGGFYVTGGISSYLMQLESYTYTASAPGYNPWTEDKSYPHSGNDFFSMVHLSAGYRFSWGKIGEVRIEPYLKIPLKGVGVGDLPMTSTGLYIGLTHSFR